MLDRISKQLRERGVRGTISHVFSRLREELWSEEVFLVMIRDLGKAAPVKRPTGLVVEDLRREHLPALYELNRQRRAPEVDKRFDDYVEAGFRGFIASIDGGVIGYYWWVDASDGAKFPDLRDFDFGFELGPGEAYGSDFYILEANRNGSVAGEMLAKIELGLADRGYTRLWGFVLAENRPARWLYVARGYKGLWTHTRKKRFFTTRVENSPDPKTYKGGADVDR